MLRRLKRVPTPGLSVSRDREVLTTPPESCQNEGRIRGGPCRAQARLTVSFQILLPVFGTSFRGDHRNTSTGICKWAGGRVVNLSRPFSQGCL